MEQCNKLSVLYVAYPLLAVSGKSAGGAEQMLLAIEHRMLAAGHYTTIAAADGSRTSGRLLATGRAADGPDQFERRESEHCAFVLDYLRRRPNEFDLIHDHSGSFFRVARKCPVPVLTTLHLPRAFYREEWFRSAATHLHFNCVSRSQARSFSDLPNMLQVVENGIDVGQFPFTAAKDDYVLWLGRICEEKAPHLAIAAALKAGVPLVIAGQVYPFRYHQHYFDRELRPYLTEDSPVRFISTPSAWQKVELLRHARAVVLTSTVEETSSLVAMEAMACGTPVVAFHRGAFPGIVTDAESGLLVDTLDEMARALTEVHRISPLECRASVEAQFDARRMAAEYEGLYREALALSAKPAAA